MNPAATPFWLLPWAAFLFLLPFEEYIATTPVELFYKLLGISAALLLALAPGRTAPIATARTLAVTGLALALGFACLVTRETEGAWGHLLPLAMLVVTYLFGASVRLREAELLATWRVWLWGAAAAAACTLVGFHQGVADGEGRAYLAIGGAVTDPNFLVAEFVLPFAFGLFFLATGRRRLETSLALALIGAATLATQSRGGLLALLAVLFATLAWQGYRRTLAALVVAGGIGYALFAPMLGRLSLAGDTTGSGRTEIWGFALEEIMANWATGLGPGGFQWAAASASGLYKGWAPHNTYLQAGLEAGLGGLAALLLVGVLHFGIARRHPQAVPIRAAMLGIAICGCFLHLLAYKLLWVAWVAAAQAALSREGPPRVPIARPRAVSSPPPVSVA